MNLADFAATSVGIEQFKQISFITPIYQDLAENILTIPPSAHRTAALRLLLESRMTLVHGITHPQQ